MNPASPAKAPLTRTPGTSLHRQLFLVLRDQILGGVYAPGALLPKEDEMCAEFGVSRITVRRALSDLEALDLLEKRQGSGTFVSPHLPPVRVPATLGFIKQLELVSSETTLTVLSFDATAQPPRDIVHQLDLPEGATALHVVRLRKSGRAPVMVTDAWVPSQLGASITRKQLQQRALFELLMEQGVRFDRVVQEITAVAATPAYAGLLQTEVGQPLLKLTRVIYDKERRPLQYLSVHISPERSRLLMDMSIEVLDTLATGSIVHDKINR
jgi:GntR family transcriptional regulator